MAEFSPMMEQYLQIKKQYEDCIIFYRLGDFYEMFFDDALTGSKELELTLTGRDCGREERAPMCGVPYHSCEAYISRLVAKGYKVAICEQMENPAAAKGIVKREIVRIITPGTVTESSMLDDTKNNYCAAVYADNSCAAVAFADISTGEVWATTIEKGDISKLQNELGRFSPSEAIIGYDEKKYAAVSSFLRDRLGCFVAVDRERFNTLDCEVLLSKQYGADYSEQSGIRDFPGAVNAAGALLSYLSSTQMGALPNLKAINLYLQAQYMEIDVATRRNLEISESMRQKSKHGSLLGMLEKTKTSMGTRLLRRWIEQPLCNAAAIHNRQGAVSELLGSRDRCEDITASLSGIYDLERLMSKVVYNTANCRDIKAISATFSKLPHLKSLLQSCDSGYLKELDLSCDSMDDLYELIEAAITDDPPFSVTEGGMIRDGYNSEVDRLRELRNGGRNFIAAMELKEREATGIKNLKISYNKVFGYYIEVTKSYYDLVPDSYIRKQTLANCERFITEELKQYEQTVLSAQDKLQALEYEVFCEVRMKIAENLHRIQRAAAAIAAIDVICCFARLAAERGYVCPEVDFGSSIIIKDGRHPVVECCLTDSLFVPNDTVLDNDENRMAIITGPNMAGKSTYMRQVAIITVMAQAGCFVPASYAKVGIIDKLFTRVGASDDLSAGQSTFMVEMSELSYILKNATKRSLLIFDEIGRGTSTFDGMSIARAVVEHVADKKKLGAKTMFATHYHELTELEQELEGVKNYNIAVKKRGDDITFLRKIVRGGADDSYGIEVALLAGVPIKVIERAKEILAKLEENSAKPVVKAVQQSDQLSLQSLCGMEIIDKLRATDVNTLTPIECMQRLFELKTAADKM